MTRAITNDSMIPMDVDRLHFNQAFAYRDPSKKPVGRFRIWLSWQLFLAGSWLMKLSRKVNPRLGGLYY